MNKYIYIYTRIYRYIYIRQNYQGLEKCRGKYPLASQKFAHSPSKFPTTKFSFQMMDERKNPLIQHYKLLLSDVKLKILLNS